MKPYEIPLEEGKIYHIYNRGNNGTNLFMEERNYAYFLEKYTLYLSPALDTFAYCLLKNHFHFLVRVKENLVENKKSLHQEGLHSHISNKPTRLQREELLTWFGDTNEYKHFHQIQHNENEFDRYIIEFD